MINLLAVILAAVIGIGQVPLALTGETVSPLETARAAGREVVYEGKAAWHDNPLLDADTNRLIASLLGEIKVAGRYRTDGEGTSYGEAALFLQDQRAISLESVLAEEGTYITSSLLPQPIAVGAEETERALTNMSAVLGGGPEAQIGGINAVGGVFDTADALFPQLTAWAETELVGEAYEGEIISALGVDIQSATRYEITKEAFFDLMDILVSALQEDDALLNIVMAAASPFMVYAVDGGPVSVVDGGPVSAVDGGPVSVDEQREEMKASLEEVRTAIAELKEREDVETDIWYAQCCGKDGSAATNIVWFTIPSAGDRFGLYLEWLPEGEQAFLEGTYNDGEGVVTLEFANQTSALDDGEKTEGSFRFLMGDAAEKMGGQVRWAYTTLPAGEADVTIGTQVALDLSMGGGVFIPLITVECDILTGDPQGLPFDPASGELAFYHPGAVSKEEFAAWVQAGMWTVLERLGQAVNLLPTDVMNALMGE